MRTQTLVQLNDVLVARVDEHAARTGRSRSATIRAAIESYLADEREAEIDALIVEGYTRIPPTDSEDAWALGGAREAIREEPW